MAAHADLLLRRADHRRRRRRACARRSKPPAAGVSVGLICKSLLGKAHTVMAEGGMAAALAQQRRPRQLEGAFRRHDARRPVREQLADGGAARQGSARSRARARGLGRGVRSHARRPHHSAQLRRPPLSAPGARRRSHRPRTDPHAAGSHHPSGRRPCTWSTPSSSCCSTAAASPACWPTTASADASTCSPPRRSCWPPAASAAPTRSPATAGKAPATATRWRIAPAPS